MSNARGTKLKVEHGDVFKKEFLARNSEIYLGWLSEQRASVAKPKLKSAAKIASSKIEMLEKS